MVSNVLWFTHHLFREYVLRIAQNSRSVPWCIREGPIKVRKVRLAYEA